MWLPLFSATTLQRATSSWSRKHGKVLRLTGISAARLNGSAYLRSIRLRLVHFCYYQVDAMYLVRIDRRYAEPLSLAAVIPVKRNTFPCFLDDDEVAR